MKLTLTRLWLTERSSCGELYIDDARFSYTLELPNKDGRPGSCIPQGTYPLSAYPSPHFGRLLPLIHVPERSEIEMHWGDYPKDTRGCVLLGYTHSQDFIGESRAAFDAFWEKAQGPIERGECRLTVIGGYQIPAQEVHLDAQDL